MIAASVALAVLVAAGAAAAAVWAGRQGDPGAPVQTAVPTDVATASTSPTTNTDEDFASVYKRASDGVLRVETTSCGEAGVGSGFLIADDLLATAAHVVAGASTIAVRQGDAVTAGTVVGMDARTDLALVRLTQPASGHVFTLSPRLPQTGSDAGVIGYPLGGPESFTRVSIGGLDRTITIEGVDRHGLVQISGGVNPGNSGGPMLDASGRVLGMVDAKNTAAEGIAWAIPSTGAGQLSEWRSNPIAVDTSGSCEAPTGPEDLTLSVTDSSNDPDGASVAAALSTYADAINSGDYDTAYGQLSVGAQERTSYDDFVNGSLTSYFVIFDIDAISGAGATRTAHATFTTVQDESASSIGASCTDWSMTYRLVEGAGGWLIDRATPDDGAPQAC